MHSIASARRRRSSSAACSSTSTSRAPTAACSAARSTRARRALGRRLAQRAPGARRRSRVQRARLVELGRARLRRGERACRYELALIRNHYVGRTFIQPTQAGRDAKVKVKYNAVREVLEGKSVVMVDDSIVRGTTTRGLVALVRAAGAREVHMRVSSAPVTGPCYYGIDTPSREELIAANIHDRGDRRAPRRRFARLSVARRHAGVGALWTRAASAMPVSPATIRRRPRPIRTSCDSAAGADVQR